VRPGAAAAGTFEASGEGSREGISRVRKRSMITCAALRSPGTGGPIGPREIHGKVLKYKAARLKIVDCCRACVGTEAAELKAS
jgi:hypothetical protein